MYTHRERTDWGWEEASVAAEANGGSSCQSASTCWFLAAAPACACAVATSCPDSAQCLGLDSCATRWGTLLRNPFGHLQPLPHTDQRAPSTKFTKRSCCEAWHSAAACRPCRRRRRPGAMAAPPPPPLTTLDILTDDPQGTTKVTSNQARTVGCAFSGPSLRPAAACCCPSIEHSPSLPPCRSLRPSLCPQ